MVISEMASLISLYPSKKRMKHIILQQKSGEDLLQTRADQEQPHFGRKKGLLKQRHLSRLLQ